MIYAIYGFTGIPRIVEGLANHLDTEEIAVEGFQLLSRLAALPDTFRVINQGKVIDLAYVALFAYSGPQHRHTRMEIKKTLHNFEKCTISDPHELATREQASRRDVTLYTLFVAAAVLISALSAWSPASNALVTSLDRSLQQPRLIARANQPSQSVQTALNDVVRPNDVWTYLSGPLHDVLFASTWYNGDAFAVDVESQLGLVDRGSILLGGVQLRMLRVKSESCGQNVNSTCYPAYSRDVEAKETLVGMDSEGSRWSASDGYDSGSKQTGGKLAMYPDSGYKVFLPHNKNMGSGSANGCDAKCRITRLQASRWIDGSTRALFAEFNLYNPAENIHLAATLLFEFAATGGVVATTRITTVAMDRYGGLFIFSPLFYAELALLAGLGWHSQKQVDKMMRYRMYYFTVPAHLVDFAVAGLWLAAITLRLRFHVETSHSLLVTLAAESAYVNLSPAANLLCRELDIQAWCACLMWCRLLRLAKTLKPLERTLDKFERAEGLLGSYLMLLAMFTFVFAQTGHQLLPSSIEGFASFGQSIALMSRALLHDWEISTPHQLEPSTAWGVLFRLCSVFVILNVAVAILRERFEQRPESKETAAPAVPDGLSILQLAKRQLKASGMPTESVSLGARLRNAARGGLNRLNRHVFAISDDPVELTELKQVWGLATNVDSQPLAAKHQADPHSSLLNVLSDAEANDRLLDEHLRLLKVRLHEAFQCLQLVQRVHHERQEARRAKAERLRRLRLHGD